MTLAASAGWTEAPGGTSYRFVVGVGETVYDGALVGALPATGSSGIVSNFGDLTDEVFVGVARVTADTADTQNATDEFVTGDTVGSVSVTVDMSGPVFKGVAVVGTGTFTDQLELVYATSEHEFTVVGGQTPVGFVLRHVSGTTCDIQLFSAEGSRTFEGR